MDARTRDSGSTSPNGDEALPASSVPVESIEEFSTDDRSRRAAALVELAELQNELGLTE
jgi:hypothetical protein